MHTPRTTPSTHARRVDLAVDGMSCGHCVRAVEAALDAVPGIAVGAVGVGSAAIDATDEAAAERAIAALTEAGYPAHRAGGGSGTTQAPGVC